MEALGILRFRLVTASHVTEALSSMVVLLWIPAITFQSDFAIPPHVIPRLHYTATHIVTRNHTDSHVIIK